jgi:hypothetical protein
MRTRLTLALGTVLSSLRAHAGELAGNLTGLFLAEEATLGETPANATWYEREPNSYSDFGGNYALTARKPITRDRQFPKGDVSDNNPTGGFQEDLTPLNMRRIMQGFLYADAREKPSTRPINGAAVALTAVDAGTKQYRAAAGMDRFRIGHLVQPFGFAAASNNLFNRVTAVAATSITVANAVVADGAPSSVSGVEVVGYQFAAGDVALTLPVGRALLTSTAGGILALSLNIGEWIGVGGDTAVTRFADAGDNAPFYGRVSGFTDTTIEFDKTTGTQVANNGAGKTIQLFFGTVIRNEDDPTLIKSRSWTLERQYGAGAGAQSDGVRGWSPNQLTITVPTPGADAKVTVDLTGIGTSSFERTVGEGVYAGGAGSTIRGALNEPCFKPGLDVYQHKLAVIDETTLNPTGLVAFNSEGTLVINNNVTGNKAIEVFGNGSLNLGEFQVTGSLGSYWTSVAATRAVRQGADVTWHLILTKANKAVIFDIASLGLGNARSTVEPNAPIKLPLDTAAGKGKFGYTLLTSFLRYVPAALVAQARI